MALLSNQDSEKIGLTDLDPISEAGRKVLRFHYLRMISHEAGTRQGEDIEELHDMRVATRRLRSAIGTFRLFYQKKYHKRFMSDLRDVGIVLGRVRDFDVFLVNLSQGQQFHLLKDNINLSDLKRYWESERETACLAMNLHLDGKRYRNLLKDFARFIETPFFGIKKNLLGEIHPPDVRSSMPGLISTHYLRAQAIGKGVDHAPVEKLHKLRIEIKKFRYCLEFFSEVLGSKSEQLIDQLKQIQDHLGKLNDANVAVEMMGELIETSTQSIRTLDQDACNKYFQYKLTERDQLQQSFPDVWHRLVNSDFEVELFFLLGRQ